MTGNDDEYCIAILRYAVVTWSASNCILLIFLCQRCTTLFGHGPQIDLLNPFVLLFWWFL